MIQGTTTIVQQEPTVLEKTLMTRVILTSD